MFKPSDMDSIALASGPCVAVMPASQQQVPTAELATLNRTPIKTEHSTPTRTFQTRHQQTSTDRGRGIATHTPTGTAPRNNYRLNEDMSPIPGRRSDSASPSTSPSNIYRNGIARETNLDEDMITRSYSKFTVASGTGQCTVNSWLSPRSRTVDAGHSGSPGLV
ncbi:hypothetical protein BGZ61DRAFT_143201 [Ilyonectria robusta]|uniref:uncharacterized protein n=1 Tax=Ilyonectria robusta TaxID=1079257 RepID=UPI001E8CF12F|nr:uncharacterized protein BGZ61DRAFT_143201 [Ilyonectria robusta]KAH8663312.1 hypothetical protein BGZ61DRAFT_143201 [Ilyonectria robusta]